MFNDFIRFVEKNGMTLALESDKIISIIKELKNVKENISIDKMKKKGLISYKKDVSTQDIVNLSRNNELNKMIMNSLDKKQIVKKWDFSNVIRQNIIGNFIKFYIEFSGDVLSLTNVSKNIDFNELIHEINDFEDSKFKNIYMALLHGFSQNVVRFIDGTETYLSLYNPINENIYKIDMFYKKKKKCFIEHEYLYRYLLFMTFDSEYNTMSILTYINPKMLSELKEYKSKEYKEKIKQIDNGKLKNITEKIINEI
jgi:hypothetical protein